MILSIKHKILIVVMSFVVVMSSMIQASGEGIIPDRDLRKLQATIEKAQKASSSKSAQRVSYKRVVRRAKSLLAKHPEAKNRFDLLAMMFDSQKTLLNLEENDRNRDYLIEICQQFEGAPDAWLGKRLESDLLLMEWRLSEGAATEEERVEALEAFLERYQDSSVEKRSLMLCAKMADKLAFDGLIRSIERVMDEKYGDEPEIIAFRRHVLNLKTLSVKCRGRYKRSDGLFFNIPGDRIGHQCLFVYWSQESVGYEKFLKQVEDQRKEFPGQFEIYSFNLDELPDAGESVLQNLGMDWHSMYLPDGKENVYFQAYGGGYPMAFFVSPFGYTVLNPFGQNVDGRVGVHGIHGGVYKISETRLSHERYLAQLQSIMIGEFLIKESEASLDLFNSPEVETTKEENEKNPKEGALSTSTLKSKLVLIQNEFLPAPFRFRISKEEVLNRYHRVIKLSEEAIEKFPNARELVSVRNRKMIAHLGLWNLLCHPKHLELAGKEAHLVLAGEGSLAMKVVARFCLGRIALRDDSLDSIKTIRSFVAQMGGEGASAEVLGAASILAIEAGQRDVHEEYRTAFLSTDAPSRMLELRNFFLNRYQRFHLMQPNTTRGDRMRWPRSYIVNHHWNPEAQVFPSQSFTQLDGSPLSVPKDIIGDLTLLIFLEPPESPDADFPRLMGRDGKPTDDDVIRRVIHDATLLSESHMNKSVKVILAFLSDDPKRVAKLVEDNGWKGTPVLVPEGLKNPMVNELDILSADRVPNVYVLRRDGRMAWKGDGLEQKSEFGFPFSFHLAMKVHIEVSEVEHGYKALLDGRYDDAVKIFSGPYKPVRPDRYGWRSLRHHGRTLGLMAVGRWEEALEAIEISIDAHKRRHYKYRGRGPKRIEDWRPGMSEIQIEDSCEMFSELWLLKSIVLRKLGREEPALAFENKSKEPTKEDRPDIYRAFWLKLKEFRSSQSGWTLP